MHCQSPSVTVADGLQQSETTIKHPRAHRPTYPKPNKKRNRREETKPGRK